MHGFAMLRSTGQKLYEIYNWAPADFCLRIYYTALMYYFQVASTTAVVHVHVVGITIYTAVL